MRKTVLLFALCSMFIYQTAHEARSQVGGNGYVAFSLSQDGDLGGAVISREEIACYGETTGTRIFFTNEGLAFMTGDIDGDGLENFPANIDALHVQSMPGATLPESIFFSTSTNCCGVKDGDFWHFSKTGGIQVHLPESYFAAITGATDGNVDVDAISLSPAGELYFSFADNEDSTLLSGSQPGMIEDGDIIRIDAANSASILYTEDDVSAMISNALGSTLKCVDVMGLSFDGVQDCLLFTVQSPSANDASLFSDANGGTLFKGYDEAALGFSNQVEMDALSVLPILQDMRAMEIEPRYPQAKQLITLTLSGGVPNEPFHLLVSGNVAPSPIPPYYGGFGVFLLDMNHPFFLSGIKGLSFLTGVYNAEGIGTFTAQLPYNTDVVDFYIQAADPVSAVFSHPITMEFNQ